jgi:hypothetical protein
MGSGLGVIIIGGMFTLLGFGKRRPSKNPEADAARANWGIIFRIAGPLLIFAGIITIVFSR